MAGVSLAPCLRVMHNAAKWKGAARMAAKNRITINLDDAEYEALQRISNVTERSLAWLGRRAICDFIEQRERNDAPLFAGLSSDETQARRSAT